MTHTEFPEQSASQLQAYVEDLHDRLGDDLVSVILYGSAARGDYVESHSDVNVLVVARRLPPSHLRSAGVAVNHWRQHLPLAPVFATCEYLETSADVFPLEFLEMRDHHVCLFGPDPLTDLPISVRRLRQQVEAELKGKLLRLRSAYAHAAGNPTAVRDLLRDSLSAFRALFEGVLRMNGEKPGRRRAEVVQQVCAAYGLDAKALDAVVRVKEDAEVNAEDLDTLFGAYLLAIEHLVSAVDAHEEAASGTL